MADPTIPQLVLPAGQPAVVGAITAMLQHSRASTLSAAEGLSAQQLSAQFDDKANPIGALLAHVAAIEFFYFVTTIEKRAMTGNEWGQWAPLLRLAPATWDAVRGQTLEQHVERLHLVREATLHGLEQMTDAWLHETFRLPWLPTPANNLWAWYHVMEDELNHRGQIRWLRQRL